MSQAPNLTHIALRVKDIDRSADFYKKYAGLNVIAQRCENETRVAWLGNPNVIDCFIIVLLEMPYDDPGGGSYHHLGLQVDSREAVEAAAECAQREGILAEAPKDHGPVAGYLCIVRDPDGNGVEFSYGQEVLETLSSPHLTRTSGESHPRVTAK